MMGTRNNNRKWIRNKTNEPKSNDELNYEELREFAQEGSNRFCFDCHQRGPTYVNMTIGSFVCMRCSGLLRGLTPPHRVKSMSMATFTHDEMEFLRERGNDYCKQVWLALYEGNVLTESSDEQEIRDFMIQKYERKRYYVDPKVSGVQFRTATLSSTTTDENSKTLNGNDDFMKNWKTTPNNNGQMKNDFQKTSFTLRERNHIKTSSPISTPKTSKPNNINNIPQVTTIETVNNTTTATGAVNNGDFIADFSKADIFVAEPIVNNKIQTIKGGGPIVNGNNNNNNTNNTFTSQPSFANFDNNPIFNAATQKLPVQSKLTSQLTSPPPEDRYAALKDLDNALKTQLHQEPQQPHIDWTSMRNSSPNSFQFSTMSPQSSSVSSFGSPMFENHLNSKESTVWNPFSSSSPYNNTSTWGISPDTTTNTMHNANPFRTFNGFNNGNTQMTNGTGNFTPQNGFYRTQQPVVFSNTITTSTSHNSTVQTNGFGGDSITANPFKLSASPGQMAYSNNPFL